MWRKLDKALKMVSNVCAIIIFSDVMFCVIAGDFIKAKSGLAKMKYILNILSELSSRIAVE